MGIFCKIGVTESSDDGFTPGSIVHGSIKYAFDKNTTAKRITVSLKGRGLLVIRERMYVKAAQTAVNHVMEEKYVTLESDVLNDAGGKQFANGEYETRFNFQLPENIPASLKYRNIGAYEITCKIAYYIKIKFEVTGVLNFDKKFEKEIKVLPTITPKLAIGPVMYGERKTFFQPFKKNKSILQLKACIKCSVLEPGEKIEVAYEVLNDTNKSVEAIETKLITVYKFYYDDSHFERNIHNVKNTESKTLGIKQGSTMETPLEIEIPSDLYCIENSKLVSRDYAVLITVCLPMPNKNMKLEIPVQIGKIFISQPISTIGNTSVKYNDPPSYWEIMNVCDGKGDESFFKDVKKIEQNE